MTAARKLVEPYYPYPEEAVPVSKPAPKPAPKRRRVPATLRICLVAACCGHWSAVPPAAGYLLLPEHGIAPPTGAGKADGAAK